MSLVRGIVDVKVVGCGSYTCIVALSEDELAVLTLKEKICEVLLCLCPVSRSTAVKRELTGVDDRLGSFNALPVVSFILILYRNQI